MREEKKKKTEKNRANDKTQDIILTNPSAAIVKWPRKLKQQSKLSRWSKRLVFAEKRSPLTINNFHLRYILTVIIRQHTKRHCTLACVHMWCFSRTIIKLVSNWINVLSYSSFACWMRLVMHFMLAHFHMQIQLNHLITKNGAFYLKRARTSQTKAHSH